MDYKQKIISDTLAIKVWHEDNSEEFICFKRSAINGIHFSFKGESMSSKFILKVFTNNYNYTYGFNYISLKDLETLFDFMGYPYDQEYLKSLIVD